MFVNDIEINRENFFEQDEYSKFAVQLSNNSTISELKVKCL